jgi:phosphoglycerol geranylgeranyltransferase
MVYEGILAKCEKGEKGLAVLIDPDKSNEEYLRRLFAEVNKAGVDWVFFGGSFVQPEDFKVCMEIVKEISNKPLVIFPGDNDQIDERADAILFLSLISGRKPDYLIGKHIEAAFELYASGIEVIPTAYLVLDGGQDSSVLKKSQTSAIDQKDLTQIRKTALAGELLGMKLIYLDAGSGAKQCIQPEVIRAVKDITSLPLIVGGGIEDTDRMEISYRAGADILVVGNVLEKNPNILQTLTTKGKSSNTWNSSSSQVM